MNKIKFSKPFLGEEEINAVSKVIRSRWITSGKVGEEFEKKFAKYVGSKYAIFLNSCTSALQLSLQWYKNKYNIKKVLVPSMTFVATINEIINAGLEPVFGDVGDDSLLSPNNSKYDAVIPVHLYGNRAQIKWNVPCIEDSAHLIEKNQCKNNNNLVCFSLFASKNITCGEGGILATNDKNCYLWAKQARHHGITKYSKKETKYLYDMNFIGWKMNQSDILAAIGIEQLKKIDTINKERKRCVFWYNKFLGYKNKGLHLYPIYVKQRKKFIKYMDQYGISCGVHYPSAHQMSIFNDKCYNLPNTEYFSKHVVSLPLFPELRNKEIIYICKKIYDTNLLIKK